MSSVFKGTTIVGVNRNGQCAIAGDGQVTMGETTIFKAGAVKVRRVYEGKAAVGFAGSVADAITLCERFEEKLKQYAGNLERAAVELTQDWRDDKTLRKLEAMMIAANSRQMLILSGTGEVLAPDDGVCAIGSGGNYALAAARALALHTDMSAADIAREALSIASSICVYTNDHITVLEV
ncbi:MAG: ATP-dependent protease subunit HslV [Oscillospiraceae bacterium]|jgi:ATP-dependent HslUV protease subunit HslV|nr:ATP-dependent protease subunit HslV [Oscillospiraceae bacterium]